MTPRVGTPVRAFPWGRLVLGAALLGVVTIVGATATGRAPSGWWAALLGVAIVGTVGLGVFFAPLGLFARPIVAARGCVGTLALTFDDGPDPVATRRVLDLLEARGHRGTFFVIATKGAAQPALLAEIAARGHGLANHSLDHARTTAFLPPSRLAAELIRAESILDAARGTGLRGRWFRAPVGIVSPRVAEAARRAKLELVSWTRTARDGTRGASVASALQRLRPALRAGAILVLHDGAERDDRVPIAPDVLESLLIELDAKSLRSVTLDELLA